MASGNKTAKVTKTWHYNILGHFFVLLLIFIVLCVIVIIKENLFSKQVESIKSTWYEYSKSFDMTLEDIIIEGRKNIKKEDVLMLLNLDRSSSFLGIDNNEIKTKIKTMPWVEAVIVKKTYLPNILQINIKEKNVIALYLENDAFYPLDENAEVIKTDFTPQSEYIVVTGEGSRENLLEVLDTVASDEAVFKNVKGLQYVSNRRWNVILDDIKDGTVIKLPQHNFMQAWKKLMKLNKTRGILKRPLTIIDLRFEDKVILKLKTNNGESSVKEIKA